jgi:hypothetical protein
VDPGWRRLQLSRPVLRLGGRGVLALPWLALPLAPGVSGLLLPEIGYSDRDGLRLLQGGYLAPGRQADLLLHAGWIQKRGAAGRARLRFNADGRAEGELRLAGQGPDEDRFRGAARGRASVHGRGWAAGAAPDLVTDRAYPADLEQPPQRVFAPHLRSRLWGWVGRGALLGLAQGDLLQELHEPLRREPLHGRVEAWLGSLPLRLLGPLSLELYGGVQHAGPALPPGGGAVGSGYLTALSLVPALNLALPAGPLRLSARAAYQLRALWGGGGDADGGGWQPAHAALLVARVSAPLSRVYGAAGGGRRHDRTAHRLEPFVGLRWAPGWPPGQPLPGGARLASGVCVVAGLQTALLRRRGARAPVRRPLRGELRLEWPLSGDPDHPPPGGRDPGPTLGWDLALAWPRPLRARLRGRWALRQNTLEELDGRACLRPGGPLRACAGYLRLRTRDPARLMGPWEPAWLLGLQPLDQPVELDQLYGELHLRRGPFALGARLAGDPVVARVTHGTYWVEWLLGCCYRLGLVGHSRLGQPWPDVGLRLSVQGSTANNCKIN